MPNPWMYPPTQIRLTYQEQVRFLYVVATILMVIFVATATGPTIAHWLGGPNHILPPEVNEVLYTAFVVSWGTSLFSTGYLLPRAELEKGLFAPRPMFMLALLIVLSVSVGMAVVARMFLDRLDIFYLFSAISSIPWTLLAALLVVGYTRSWLK